MKTIRLKEGKERSLLRRHPWIFDSAIARGGADAGETVRVESHAGDFLAWAAFSPTSRIRARAWSFDEQQRIDAAFLGTLIERAVRTRELFDIRSDGLRLIHGESDGLPGLIVDRYGDTLVAQFTSCGVERWKDVIADALLRTTGLSRLYERSDASARTLEGLPEATGWLRGDGPTELSIREHDWRLTLDIATGHKTGFYLDQRDSRARFAAHARHRGFQRVLNCYCYTGGFTVAALAGGAAHVTSIDSSAPALERARPMWRSMASRRRGPIFWTPTSTPRCGPSSRRGAASTPSCWIRRNSRPLPPTPNGRHAPTRTSTGWPSSLLEPGGELFTYSCSGGISADLFHKIVASAGIDAGVEGCISERLQGAPDHPMTIHFPEGEYLKGLVVVKKPL
jgi:23S rRNA (cytosine1962-C5)-methyltransferase